LKDLTVSAIRRKMIDFSEVAGDPRGASRPDLWSKARPSQRALSFRNLLINWLLGEKCKPLVICDSDKALHLLSQGKLSNCCTNAPLHKSFWNQCPLLWIKKR